MSMNLTVRKLVLALAVLALGGTMVFAQTAPGPQNPGSPQPADPAASAPDPDKKLVQDRWGTATGATSSKLLKKDKPQKAQPANPAGSPQ